MRRDVRTSWHGTSHGLLIFIVLVFAAHVPSLCLVNADPPVVAGASVVAQRATRVPAPPAQLAAEAAQDPLLVVAHRAFWPRVVAIANPSHPGPPVPD